MWRSRKMTDILGKIIYEIIESVFPRRCPVCGEIVKEKGHLICRKCIKKLPFVKSPYCIRCGKEIISEDDAYCDDCKGEREFTAGRALCNYTDDMRYIILKIKYDNKREYLEGFAKLMLQILTVLCPFRCISQGKDRGDLISLKYLPDVFQSILIFLYIQNVYTE